MIRLDDERLLVHAIGVEVGLKVVEIKREDPCLGAEIVFLGKQLLHALKVARKLGFARQVRHTREMVHLLIRQQDLERVDEVGHIDSVDVAGADAGFVVLVRDHLPAAVARDLAHDFVLAERHVDAHSLLALPGFLGPLHDDDDSV